MLSLQLEEYIPVFMFNFENLAVGNSEWATHLVNRESLVLLFVNSTFITVILLGLVLFMVCLTHTGAPTIDLITSIKFLAVAFLAVNMLVANFLVQRMNMNKDLRIIV